MKKGNILQIVVNNAIIPIAAMMNVFLSSPVYAQAQGLRNAKNVLETFKDQLMTIIPIAAAIILLCLAIGYAGRYIEKDTFVRWAIGVVIAGSAIEIANLLFKGN
ncbi:VirB2 family type IV secretion system major pilin TrwL [Bartonella sp. B23]